MPIVQNVRERVKLRMDEKGIQWKESYSDESIALWGDTERLTQILFNILDNAIRHTEAGEVSVMSNIVGQQLHVKISDTGEGIAPEILPHIFERFFTRRSSEDMASHRSGLGLTITKHLVELMQGQINVESKLGQGTIFTLRFPILDNRTKRKKI